MGVGREGAACKSNERGVKRAATPEEQTRLVGVAKYGGNSGEIEMKNNVFFDFIMY